MGEVNHRQRKDHREDYGQGAVRWGWVRFYLANSMQRVSRMTVTRIWPGYWSSSSIFLERLRARANACSSLIFSGWTRTRSSRPAWTAKHFSTPGKEAP